MTLDNCLRLKKHYEDLVSGAIPKPFGHRNWEFVVNRAKENLQDMEARIQKKLKNPKYADHPLNKPTKTKEGK